MTEIQATGVLVAAACIAIGVVNYVLVSRKLIEIRVSELKASKARLRIQLYEYMTEERFERAISEILWGWEWSGWDDYWEKYSPLKDPEANVTRRIARSYYVSLANLVRDGLVDLETIYELNPTGVTRYWEKIEPIAREFRRRNDYPGYLEPVEYLAGEMEKLMESKGSPHPKPLKTDESG